MATKNLGEQCVCGECIRTRAAHEALKKWAEGNPAMKAAVAGDIRSYAAKLARHQAVSNKEAKYQRYKASK